jgi:hypothetical protein
MRGMKRITGAVCLAALLALAAAPNALAAISITPNARGVTDPYPSVTTARLGDHFYSGVTVSGGANTPCNAQCGTLAFGSYPPSDPTCAGIALDGADLPFYGDSPYLTGVGSGVTATELGTYRMKGSLTGAPNGSGSMSCTAAVIVSKAHPTLTVAPSAATVIVGTPVHATATLTDAYLPTSPVNVQIFGPDDPTCSGITPVSDAAVAGPGPYVGPDYVPTELGTYHAKAIFNGDTNNDGSTANCDSTTAFEVGATPPPAPPPGTTAGATGQRAAALKKCKKKKSAKARRKCKRKAKKLPV